MKKQMKKLIGVISLCLAMMMGVCACGSGAASKEITVTFMNGDVELGKVTAKAGETVTGFEAFENVEGFAFQGWFETPSFLESSKVDFATATYEEDMTVYGSFKNTQVTEDTRVWTICGTGLSPALALSNWNNGCEDAAVTFTATGNNPNEFQLTLDLFAGDQFQIIHDHDWVDQRGFGWFTEIDTTQFENGGGLGGSDKTSNVNVIMDGNYTITLTTDPDNSLQDTMTIVRNGDPAGAAAEPESEAAFAVTENTQVMVKGSWVEDWSEVKELTRAEGTATYSITMELAADTELYFMIWEAGEDTGLGLKYENVTEDTKGLLVDTYNVKVPEAGTYTFTVDVEAMTIAVSK